VVTLFDQTLPAEMGMFYIKETVFGVQDGAQLMAHTHPCLIALTGHSIALAATYCNSFCLDSEAV
jgi:hypothetical protein